MKKAETLMIQGTGSGVGKSVLTSAFCRIFVQDGYSIAPFKAQNMALNSFVTKDGGEIGRAQAVQAMAARIEPSVDMNPVLMKPSSDRKAQIILYGRPIGNLSAVKYSSYKRELFAKVTASLERLRAKHDMVVIEGAGSPAEVNLRKNDIVNMSIALHSSTPVILVGDIDKGGVIAWLVGTLELLSCEERKLVKGFIINKFRGDKRLFSGGIKYLEKKTGKKVLGVIPYMHDINIPEEDSVPLEQKFGAAKKGEIKVAVVYLPHISNFTDFDPLCREPDVELVYARKPDDLEGADIVIIPGTKNTIGDLLWLEKTGFTNKIKTVYSQDRCALVGICGGYQMLGKEIVDSHRLESKNLRAKGLSILPVITSIEKNKNLRQVRAKDINTGIEVIGYEIHHGKTTSFGTKPVFRFVSGAKGFDGAFSKNFNAWGTYIHGVFDSDEFRRTFLNKVRAGKKLQPLAAFCYEKDSGINALADIVRKNVDMKAVYDIITKGV